MSKTLPDLPPFRVPGSPDHINDHDLFDIWLAAVRDAFYPSPKYDFPAIPDPAVHGNPGHVEAHNRLRACAEYMKATDYASDSSFPPIPAEADEGAQGHVVAHNEFRDVFAYVAAHPPSRYNSATGGTVTEVDNYNGTGQKWRVHTFTVDGTFNVTKAAKPFRVLVGGGGGGGAGGGGASGASGSGGRIWKSDLYSFKEGATVSATIGKAGSAGPSKGDGGPGGSTTFGDVATCAGGAAGRAYPNGKTPYNANVSSDINGTESKYGYVTPTESTPPQPTWGGCGDGGGHGLNGEPGHPGGSGVVIVAYQIG